MELFETDSDQNYFIFPKQKKNNRNVRYNGIILN